MFSVVAFLLLSLRPSWGLPPYQAPLILGTPEDTIPGEYIVVLSSKLSVKEVTNHIEHASAIIAEEGDESALIDIYNIGNFKGYAAKLTDRVRDHLRSMNEIVYIESNEKVHADNCTLQTVATWGIVRTTYRNLPTIAEYSYETDGGNGVNVYIIDTGIETTHPDFEGRAKWGVDFVDDPSPMTDLHGHGTHVAGTVMSNTYGVAKKATAIAVRVLNENGSGTKSGVISGINWVAAQHTPGKKSVANMSLGGSSSAVEDAAVDAAVELGVNFVVSAGNSNTDACSQSPASASQCVTVMASDSSDKFAIFSNYGTCTDIIAPGVKITSTWLEGGINTISGTSMASPHVAGVVAKYLSSQSTVPSPANVKAWLINNASTNKISNVPTTLPTPNKLLFMDCL
ncbi:hypothetical protein EMCRGX_G023009 [Ephydatia muelleri]